MSASLELQDLLIALLKGDTGVAAIVADRIVDGDDEKLAFPNITVGPSEFIPLDLYEVTGRIETLQIDCWTRDAGKRWPCRQLVDAVKAALHDKTADLGTNALASLLVERALVMPDPDGITAHGVVQVQAEIEER